MSTCGERALAGDHVSVWRTQHQVPGVVGQQGRVLLLHGLMPVRVSEGGADEGGDRGGIQWISSRIDGQDQPIDRPKNTGGMTSHVTPGF